MINYANTLFVKTSEGDYVPGEPITDEGMALVFKKFLVVQIVSIWSIILKPIPIQTRLLVIRSLCLAVQITITSSTMLMPIPIPNLLRVRRRLYWVAKRSITSSIILMPTPIPTRPHVSRLSLKAVSIQQPIITT